FGTNHFNNKSREVKINAAWKLQKIIQHTSEARELTFAEVSALTDKDSRLGKIVSEYGGLASITNNACKEKELIAGSLAPH
ncbi:MAG: hypothetical protein ACHP9Y_05040, partial [Gammaproteobacteria bacterium]